MFFCHPEAISVIPAQHHSEQGKTPAGICLFFAEVYSREDGDRSDVFLLPSLLKSQNIIDFCFLIYNNGIFIEMIMKKRGQVPFLK